MEETAPRKKLPTLIYINAYTYAKALKCNSTFKIKKDML